eukprot:Nk52_evm18s152 gene=Nk52_evmTU18s152
MSSDESSFSSDLSDSDNSEGMGGRGNRGRTEVVSNQPFDEALDVSGSEDVASLQSGNMASNTNPPRGGGGSGRDRGGRGGKVRGDSPPAFDNVDNDEDEDDDEDSDSLSDDGDDDNYRAGGGDRVSSARPGGRGGGGGGGGDQGGMMMQQQRQDDSEQDSSSEGDSDGEMIEGQYNPEDYENLPVSSEIKDLFQYITRYKPIPVEMEYNLRPFIPDFIPAVGDIDAFIKVPRPDLKPDNLGLLILDEPATMQSDPTVLDLTLRAISKQANLQPVNVRHVKNAQNNPKAIAKWISSITELHREKPPPTVSYTKNMPDIDSLMQEWPPEFEDCLTRVKLPSAELATDLPQFVKIICTLLDIPTHDNHLVESLHVLFTLYSEFKQSQHFNKAAEQQQDSLNLNNPDVFAAQEEQLMMSGPAGI